MNTAQQIEQLEKTNKNLHKLLELQDGKISALETSVQLLKEKKEYPAKLRKLI